MLSSREERWLHLISQFNFSKISIKPERLHVMGDVFCRAPNVINFLADLSISTAEVPNLCIRPKFMRGIRNPSIVWANL